METHKQTRKEEQAQLFEQQICTARKQADGKVLLLQPMCKEGKKLAPKNCENENSKNLLPPARIEEICNMHACAGHEHGHSHTDAIAAKWKLLHKWFDSNDFNKVYNVHMAI